MADHKWESYEQVAAHLLALLADRFGLGKVEGKQVVPGASGARWEIDAKGWAADGQGFVIVECKRYTTSTVKQETLAGLAFRIQDTGAAGGIIVTPLGFQEGAAKVAAHTGIKTITLTENATTTDYVLRFLNTVFVGLSDTVNLNFQDELTIIKKDKDGNIVDVRKV